MKTLAFIAFSGLVAFAFAAPDHFQTVPSVLCTDVPAQTITVTKECGASAQATAVASSTEDQTNRWSRPEDIIVVTVTKTLPPVTVTETASHASYTTIAPSSSTLSTEVAMMSTATATTTAAGSKQTFHVDVGAFQNGAKKDFLFKPNNISANVGDVVLFNMLGASHSVTQSKFFTPCIKSGPFDTELQDNKKNTTDLIVEEYVVADKNPTWFYCKQRGPPVHCGTGESTCSNIPKTSCANTISRHGIRHKSEVGCTNANVHRHGPISERHYSHCDRDRYYTCFDSHQTHRGARRKEIHEDLLRTIH